MRKLASALLLFFILSLILSGWSGMISDKITEFIAPTQKSKALQSANIQLQRAMASSSLSLATDEISFLDEAIKRAGAALKLLPKNNSRLNEDIKRIKHLIQSIHDKKVENESVSKKELLNLYIEVENFGKKLHKKGQEAWGVNLDLFGNLITNYKMINWAIRVFQVASLLLFAYLLYIFYQREKSERALREQEKLHGLLFSSLSEAVFLCTPDGIIKSCNHSAGVLANCSPQELTEQSIFSVISEERFPPKERVDNLKDLINKGESYGGITTSAKINDEIKWLSLNTQPLTKNNNNNSFQMILSIRDITKGVEAEKVIKNQQEQLIESAKLQSIGEIASGIAHEINNPLAVISTSTSRLSRKAGRSEHLESEVVKTVTNKISNTVERIAKIVRSLLAMSHGESNQKSKATIDEIIGITLDFCNPLLERHEISFDVNQLNSELEIDCHPTQISQVLLNLIKNSVEAIDQLPEKWIEITVIDQDTSVRIEVVDSGGGIPRELQEQVLLPFYTTKPVGKGTGLGLSISRKIVETHDGNFGVDPHNKHTCFFIELPKQHDDDEVQEIKVMN